MSGDELTGASKPADPYPWLAYQDSGQPGNHAYCQVSPSGVVGRGYMPELKDSEVLYCTHDGRWLLLLQSEGRLSIRNQTTGESKVLPSWPISGDEGKGLISCSPDDPNCMIYLFMEGCSSLAFCRVGADRWNLYDYRPNVEAQTPICGGYERRKHTCCRIYQPVSLNGKVYGMLTCFNQLVEIEVNEENADCSTGCILKDYRIRAIYDASRVYLVPWEGRDLYLINVRFANSLDFMFRELPIIMVILKFNFTSNAWCRAPGLNGGSIFLGDYYSLASSSCLTPSQVKSSWSFVYYLSHHNQMLYSHRIEDGRVTSYAPSPAYLDSWQPRWIIPAEEQKFLGIDAGEQKAVEDDESVQLQVGSTSTSRCDLKPVEIELIAERVSSFVAYTFLLNIHNKLDRDVARLREKAFGPCLIYRDMMKSIYFITDSSINRKIHVEIPQQARGKRIGCCRDGWLLVSLGNSCCLFNPLNQRVIEIDDFKCKNGGYGISNLTVLMSPSSPAEALVFAMSLIYQRTGPELIKQDATVEGRDICWTLVVKEFQASCNSPTLLGGVFYHLGCGKSSGWLGRLYQKDDTFSWGVEKIECPCVYYTRNFLTECDGELVSVYIGDEEESWLQVFKFRKGPNGKK